MEQNHLHLIVGLGNPGTEYAQTRHNVGFEVIDILAKRHSIPLKKRQHQAVFGEGTISGKRVVLTKPMTFMNLSGQAVGQLLRYYKIPVGNCIIILDDLNLALGRLRLKEKGSAGGQNGLDNIIKCLNTPEVPRIRIGIGSARPGQMVNFVLSRFSREEQPMIDEAINLAADAVETAVAESFQTAMNRYNINGTS